MVKALISDGHFVLLVVSKNVVTVSPTKKARWGWEGETEPSHAVVWKRKAQMSSPDTWVKAKVKTTRINQ